MLNSILTSMFNPRIFLSKTICKIRSWWYTRLVDGSGKIVVLDPFQVINIKKAPGAQLYVHGLLKIYRHMDGRAAIVINLAENARLEFNGDFCIGQGVRMYVHKNAELVFGGKDKESDSGITSDVLIMVYKSIKVGKDFLCAWNVFLSDSDWHAIDGQVHHKDIVIGNHVWVANNSSILKGVVIDDNCIVASHSKLINKSYIQNSLIAGTPGKIVKSDVNWCRDFE